MQPHKHNDIIGIRQAVFCSLDTVGKNVIKCTKYSITCYTNTRGTMPQFNMKFSKLLIDAANAVRATDAASFEANRTVLYLSKLSCEITLKALLENAGKPIREIRALSHNLIELQNEFSLCEVEDDSNGGHPKWIIANGFRGEIVDNRFANATVGLFLDAETLGATKYPNQIRYGDKVIDFPAELWPQAALILSNWGQRYWGRIRIKK